MARARQASDALIQYESSASLVPMQLMDNDSATVYSISETPWSNVAGNEPSILPNGIVTGCVVTPTAVVDQVQVTGGTAYLAGVLTGVGANATLAIPRPDAATCDIAGGTGAGTGTDDCTHVIHSIIINDSGVIAVANGTQGLSFSETRDAAGGPPLIAVDAIEVAQVRLSARASAVILPTEIFSALGQHRERYDYPLWTENFATGEITFAAAIPSIHVGPTRKRVYAEVYTPNFTDLEPASEFVPAETTHSQSSTQVYGGTIGASSSALGQASFTVYLSDGITDPFLAFRNQALWVKFFPDRNRAPYMLTQGTLGVSRTFPAGDSIQAACTLSADAPTQSFTE